MMIAVKHTQINNFFFRQSCDCRVILYFVQLFSFAGLSHLIMKTCIDSLAVC